MKPVDVESVVRGIGDDDGPSGVMFALLNAVRTAISERVVVAHESHVEMLREVALSGPAGAAGKLMRKELDEGDARAADDPSKLDRGSPARKVVFYTFLACLAGPPAKPGNRHPCEGYAIGALEALSRLQLAGARNQDEMKMLQAELAGKLRSWARVEPSGLKLESERKSENKAAQAANALAHANAKGERKRVDAEAKRAKAEAEAEAKAAAEQAGVGQS